MGRAERPADLSRGKTEKAKLAIDTWSRGAPPRRSRGADPGGHAGRDPAVTRGGARRSRGAGPDSHAVRGPTVKSGQGMNAGRTGDAPFRREIAPPRIDAEPRRFGAESVPARRRRGDAPVAAAVARARRESGAAARRRGGLRDAGTVRAPGP